MEQGMRFDDYRAGLLAELAEAKAHKDKTKEAAVQAELDRIKDATDEVPPPAEQAGFGAFGGSA